MVIKPLKNISYYTMTTCFSTQIFANCPQIYEVPCYSKSTQRPFPFTASTVWTLQGRRSIFMVYIYALYEVNF